MPNWTSSSRVLLITWAHSLSHWNVPILLPHAVNCVRFCFWRCLWLFCLFVCEISLELLNRFAPNSKGRRAWSRAWTSLNVKVKGQGNHWQKRGFRQISRELPNGFSPNSHRRRVLSLARMSLKVKGQFWQLACVLCLEKHLCFSFSFIWEPVLTPQWTERNLPVKQTSREIFIDCHTVFMLFRCGLNMSRSGKMLANKVALIPSEYWPYD